MKKIKYLILLFLFANVFGLSAQEDYNKAQQKPNQKEVVLNKGAKTSRGYNSYQSAYKAALREAQNTYSDKTVAIRNLSKGDIKINGDGSVLNYYNYTIVELPSAVNSALYDAIQKATATIEEECRFAIEKIVITDQQSDKENIKSQIVDLLLKKGHKVVAKEYLENLYKEQQGQQSGIYNDKTTIESNNFTASGYYLRARITEEYVLIEVINVSTGEFEGNVSVEL